MLLAAYFFLTVVPLLLIESSYVYSDPSALARRIERRLGLERSTSKLFDTVMVGASGHKLAAALLNARFDDLAQRLDRLERTLGRADRPPESCREPPPPVGVKPVC